MRVPPFLGEAPVSIGLQKTARPTLWPHPERRCRRLHSECGNRTISLFSVAIVAQRSMPPWLQPQDGSARRALTQISKVYLGNRPDESN